MKGLIIGFGNMGQNHYERYKMLNTEIVAIIDNDLDKRQAARNLGLKSYESLEDYLLNNNIKDINFVDICLPTDLHFNCIKQVIEISDTPHIPIIVEKPLVRTASEANELEILANEHPGIIFVAEVEHYNSRITDFLKEADPAHIKVSRMVNKAYFLEGTNKWSLDSQRSGGPILDLMIHDFSLLDSAFGEAILINGSFKAVKYNCVDEATVTLQYPDDLQAEVTGSWLSDNVNPIVLTIEVIEKDGAIKKLVVDDYTIRGTTYENDAFYLEIKTFIDAIATNTQPVHQLNEYLRVVKLANNIIDLATQKKMPYNSLYFKQVINKLEEQVESSFSPSVNNFSSDSQQ